MTGAKQPNYLVTADDVDAYLAIEVQPLDDRKRKVMSLIYQIFMRLPECSKDLALQTRARLSFEVRSDLSGY